MIREKTTYALNGRDVITHASGDLKELEAWKEKEMRLYPTAGYGTREVSRGIDADGTVSITIGRYTSCE